MRGSIAGTPAAGNARPVELLLFENVHDVRKPAPRLLGIACGGKARGAPISPTVSSSTPAR